MLNFNAAKYLCVTLLIYTFIGFVFAAEPTTGVDLNQAVEDAASANPFEMMRMLSQPQAQSAPALTAEEVEQMPELFVETVMLKFLKAKNIKPAVENLVAPFGVIATDDETNTLIVSGSREQVDKVLTQVRKADQTPRQIMIDVVILDVLLDDDNEMGVDWNLTSILGGVDNNQNYQHTLTSITTGATFNFLRSGIDISVKALQQKKNVEILSSPRIMVLSGQTASIKTVEEIPYEESSDTSEGGSLTSVQFKEAGITLEVSPIITDEGKIILNVKPSQSVKTGDFGKAGTGADGIPIVDKREVDTTLLLDDGQTVVIGGLRKKHESQTTDKVPLIGDAPIVGSLFRNDKTEIVNSELLVMLCPKIYKNEQTLSEFEQQKYDELKNRNSLEFKAEQPKLQQDLKSLGEAIFSVLSGE